MIEWSIAAVVVVAWIGARAWVRVPPAHSEDQDFRDWCWFLAGAAIMISISIG